MTLNWFNGLVAGGVIIILAVSGGNAVMGFGFDALSVAGAASMLLCLPILVKLASRNPKPPRKR